MPESEPNQSIQPGESKELAEDAEHFLKRANNARLNRELNKEIQGLVGMVEAAHRRMKPDIYKAWLERKDSPEHREIVDVVYQAQVKVTKETGGGGTGKPEYQFPAQPYIPADLLLRAAIAVLENPIDVANDPRWDDKVEDRGQQDYFLGKVRTALNILGYDVVTAETATIIEHALARGDDEVTIKIPKNKEYGMPL